MKTINILYQIKIIKLTICLSTCLLLVSSCQEFLEVDDPFGQIPHQEVFKDEITARAAVTTLYGKLRDQILLTGKTSGLSFTMSLYSDELDSYYNIPGHALELLYQHQVLPSNSVVTSLWNNSYHLIYLSNTALESLNESITLTQAFKDQLRGEVLFIRALAHFYLVNLYGDVPYITTTDYELNSQVSRVPTVTVYENIITDLTDAKFLLTDAYVSNERTRANSWVVSALLARVYLYLEQWENAENESSLLINNSSLFYLETNLENEFLKGSRSAILQLKPKNSGDNTYEASVFKFSSGIPPFGALTESFVDDMETGDLRREHWIGQVTDGTNNFYYPNKYKQSKNTGVSLEYSIVFRLAEQYLIRAEARAMQSDLSGAQQDINAIRLRAGLQDTPAATTEEIFKAILKERRFELFTEYGHRWFDLLRFGMAGEILSPIKSGWQATDILLPIPESELLMNPNLNPQNSGY